MGPVAFIINASSFKCMTPGNVAVKYADNYLIVPSKNSSYIPSELVHVSFWAEVNNLKLNCDKSHELIV